MLRPARTANKLLRLNTKSILSLHSFMLAVHSVFIFHSVFMSSALNVSEPFHVKCLANAQVFKQDRHWNSLHSFMLAVHLIFMHFYYIWFRLFDYMKPIFTQRPEKPLKKLTTLNTIIFSTLLSIFSCSSTFFYSHLVFLFLKIHLDWKYTNGCFNTSLFQYLQSICITLANILV
jgi:hypothetical protein